MSSEGASDGQEKSFDASEQKIKKSREQGDTAQSTETSTFVLYLGFALTVLLAGDAVVKGIYSSLLIIISRPGQVASNVLIEKQGFVLQDVLGQIVLYAFPVLVIPGVFIILSLVIQQSIVVAPVKIKPKLSKIGLISNAKQKYGPGGLAEFLKRLAKLLFVAAIALYYFTQEFPTLPALSGVSPNYLITELKDDALKLLLYMLIASAFIAAIDLPYKRFSYFKKLRMTLQEVRDEMKDSEGDPYLKRERRARAAALTQSTMLQDITSADVVIVNPTHYAVALKWAREEGGVPVCVAKGVDEMAMRIRGRADMHDVPIHSNPPCARSLYATVEIGDGIQPEHYAAVAAAIHYADQFKTAPY
ncbi:MAG: flagellar biosynthesis protein FlhB [Hyphomonadaceae bacterium]|nr:flagellar biosynthesis protein FlhB [Hyphomonadaceae bacterium]